MGGILGEGADIPNSRDRHRSGKRSTAAAGRGPEDGPQYRRDRLLLGLVVIVLLLWLAWTLPMALGWRTLFLRDVLLTHAPYKAFGAEQLEQGLIPAFNPQWALGQPFSGNPNALPFYPGNLLYLILPFWSAFNLHYAVHLLVGLVAMTALARGLGLSRHAAVLAGVSYALSGWFLSCLTFYNLLAVAAWWPVVLLGASRGGRRWVALSGLALGMALLGGEPLMAMLGWLPVVWLAISKRGWRTGLVTSLLIGAIGVLIAAPQIVASVRILDFTVRGGPGLPTPKPGIGALTPVRLLELVLPFPLGVPGARGSFRYWLFDGLPAEPYFFTIYFGVVGLWLASVGRRRAGGWLWLAISGLAGALLLGYFPRLLMGSSGGLFRYPEKLLFWFALAAPLMAGHGFDELGSRARTRAPELLVAGLGLIVLVLAMIGAHSPFMAALAARLPELPEITDAERLQRTLRFVESHLLLLRLGLASAGLLSLAGWLFVRRRWKTALIGLQLLALAQLFPLVRTMPLAGLTAPSPWFAELRDGGPGTALLASVTWHGEPDYTLPGSSEAEYARIRALDLLEGFGVVSGLSYPLAADLEGIYSPLHAYLRQFLTDADWTTRIRWLQVLGIEYAILTEDPAQSGLERIRSEDRFGVETTLFRVRDPAPSAWWPRRVRAVSEPAAQLEALGSTGGPLAELLTPVPVPHEPGGVVELLETTADRWRLRVVSAGGVLAIRRSFQPTWSAWSGDRELAVFPVNYCLTGVVVPAGETEVDLVVDRRPEWLAALIALAAMVTVSGVGLKR